MNMSKYEASIKSEIKAGNVIVEMAMVSNAGVEAVIIRCILDAGHTYNRDYVNDEVVFTGSWV